MSEATSAAVATPPPAPSRPPILVVPSVLPADQSRLGEAVEQLCAAGVDRIQWDIMDGRFVPNMTYGPDVVAACKARSTVPFEAQLMVAEPERMLERWVEAGCEVVLVHAESTIHLHGVLARVHDLGARPGVVINPSTPASAVRWVLDLVDVVQLMTVNPGFGGQRYLASMEPKIAEVRHMVDTLAPSVEVEIDGGVTPDTVHGAAAAGANVFVSGSGLFRDAQGLSHAVAELRADAELGWAGRGGTTA